VKVFLNLVLLVVGTTATLAAFGGKTWREGSEPILERITQRGWVSLICLVLALGLGIVKEINTEAAAKVAKAEADKKQAADKAEADTRQEELKDKLAKSEAKLTALQALDEATKERLGETKVTLDDVRKSLSSARDDLSEQSVANVVTSLANGNVNVKDILIYIPLTLSNQSVVSKDVLLPHFDLESCRRVTKAEVKLMTGHYSYEEIDYQSLGKSRSMLFTFDKKIGVFQVIPTDLAESRELYKKPFGQNSTSSHIYAAGVNKMSDSLSAAELFYQLSQSGSEAAYIEASWPPSAYPSSCVAQMERYMRVAFAKAILIVELDQRQNETVIFKLKALPPVKREDSIENTYRVNFVVASTPIFAAAKLSFLDQIFEDVPQ
jgi:hypothetical protein